MASVKNYSNNYPSVSKNRGNPDWWDSETNGFSTRVENESA